MNALVCNLPENFRIVVARIVGKAKNNFHLFLPILHDRNFGAKIDSIETIRRGIDSGAEQFFGIVQKHRDDLIDVGRVERIGGSKPRNEIGRFYFRNFEKL